MFCASYDHDLTNTKVTRIERLFTDGGSNKTNAKLAEVTFPATMGTVVNDAFNGCSALATVNFVTPTGNQTINNGAFVGTAITTLDLTNSKVTAINQLFTDFTTTSNATLATVKLAKATADIYGNAELVLTGSYEVRRGPTSTLYQCELDLFETGTLKFFSNGAEDSSKAGTWTKAGNVFTLVIGGVAEPVVLEPVNGVYSFELTISGNTKVTLSGVLAA